MTERQLRIVRAWWESYVRRFDSTDADQRQNMQMKESHTRRVCREALAIGRALKLPPPDLRLAETIVLLHDVGRFPQYAHYRTFSDARSENHALLGLKIIRNERVLRGLPRHERTIVRRSILCHNMAQIPRVSDARTLLFARLLRDADKLDIWRVVIANYAAPRTRKNKAISAGLPDLPGVSRKALQELRARHILSRKNLKRLNDMKLLQMGWVFDVNFLPTFRMIKRRSYLKTLASFLPRGAIADEAYAIVSDSVRQSLSGG